MYARALHVALHHRPTVFATGIALFVLSLYLGQFIGVELQPTTDEGEVTVDAELAVGTRVESTEAVLHRARRSGSRELVPEATMLITSASGGGMGGGWAAAARPPRQHQRPAGAQGRARAHAATRSPSRCAASCPGIPGVIVRARPSGGQQMRGMPGGGQGGDGSRFSVEIRGHELDVSKRVAQDVKTLLDSTPGIADSRVGREEGRPEIAVRVDRDKAAMLGLTVTGVANTIRTNLAGTQAAMFREGGNEYPIVVRLREEDRSEISSVGDVLLSTPQGQVVAGEERHGHGARAGTGADRAQESGAHPARQRRSRDDAERSASTRCRRGCPRSQVPQGFSVGFGNEVEEQAKSFRELQLVLILAILLVYTVMASQYESLRDPFIIMFSIPLASIGVVGALLLTNTPFSMQAYIGIIMLAGIVVSNAILLVDYANTLRHRDKMERARRRSRPPAVTGCGRF